jgi:hypothetical protein
VPGQPTTLQSREAGCQAGSAAWVRACGGEGEQGIGAAGSGRKQRSRGRVTGEQVCATPTHIFSHDCEWELGAVRSQFNGVKMCDGLRV